MIDLITRLHTHRVCRPSGSRLAAALRAVVLLGFATVLPGSSTRPLEGQLTERLYREACDGGGVLECNLLGIMYETGDGVTQDLPRAATLFQQACDGEFLQSCARLGVMYGNGTGVPRDLRRALELFQEACTSGDAESCSQVRELTRTLFEECMSTFDQHPSPLAELLDSASLQRELTDFWNSETGLVIASVAMGLVVAQDSTRVWSQSLSDGSHTRLVEILEEAVPEASDYDGLVYLFIGDEAGPALRRVRRFAACSPRILESAEVVSRIERGAAALGLQQQRTVVLGLWVQADGTVGEVRIRATSGDVDVDFTAAEVLRTATFEPATVEGFASGVWIDLPVTFNASRR